MACYFAARPLRPLPGQLLEAKRAFAAGGDRQLAGRHRQLEPARTGAARVDDQHARRLAPHQRPVRVAADDLAGLRRRGMQRQGQRRRHGSSPGAAVLVAAHGADRREPRERRQHLRVADVAGVDGVVAAGEEIQRLRPQQPVGVGDQPDAQHQPRPGPGSPDGPRGTAASSQAPVASSRRST
jgi:hypothetical protein